MRHLLSISMMMGILLLPGPLDAAGPGPAKAPQTGAHFTGGVTAIFARGNKLFDAGKYQEALITFDYILKKYPAYEPNKKMLARSLYKLDRLPESWTFFSRINPTTLAPDAAYEFGVVAFNAHQYEASLIALRRVPDGHSLQDLACYYGGLAALKLRHYDESEAMFERAQVLPDRFARNRGLYLKHVQQLRLLQETNDLKKEREAEKTRIARTAGGPSLNGGERTELPTATPAPVANMTYEHKGFMEVKRLMKFNGEQRTQLSDKHGFSNSSTTIKIGSFKFQQGPLLPFGLAAESAKVAAPRRNAFGMQILFGGEDRGVKGKEHRMVIVESDQDIVRQLQTDPINTHRQLAYVGANPWLEFPMADDLWLQTGITSYFEYPDFKRLGRTGTVKAMAGVGAKRGKTSWQLTGTAGSFLDSNNKSTTDTKDATAVATYDFNDSTNLEVAGTIKDFKYKNQSLDGPDQALSLGATLSYTFGAGISTSIFGAYERQKNAFFHGLPTYDELSADGDTLTGEFSVVAKPASWITVELVQTISKTTWSIHRDDAKLTFQENVPDFLSLFKGVVSINFPF